MQAGRSIWVMAVTRGDSPVLWIRALWMEWSGRRTRRTRREQLPARGRSQKLRGPGWVEPGPAPGWMEVGGGWPVWTPAWGRVCTRPSGTTCRLLRLQAPVRRRPGRATRRHPGPWRASAASSLGLGCRPVCPATRQRHRTWRRREKFSLCLFVTHKLKAQMANIFGNQTSYWQTLPMLDKKDVHN